MISASFTIQLWSQDALSPELARLKTSYQAAVTKAVTPLTSTYRKELERLMDGFTRAGKLDQALQVKKELATLDGASLARTEQQAPPNETVPAAAPVTDIVGTVWVAKTGFLRRLEFRAKGAMTVTNENDKVYSAFTYKQAQDGSFVITSPAEPKPGTFRFTNQGAVLEGLFEKKTFKLDTAKK
ncbi:MAG: hypothetical protein JNM99_07070 [Verrucomicrobiaceae bacterium]|nr:hypothetical protein [Verrucomicrobiaceae bacterium]